jgi:hypothetical protein
MCEYVTFIHLQRNQTYWFMAQAMDHTFPPQIGRVASDEVRGCRTMFRSVYFSYLDWTPVSAIFGVPYDASQEFECECTTPTTSTRWGKIKALYR